MAVAVTAEEVSSARRPSSPRHVSLTAFYCFHLLQLSDGHIGTVLRTFACVPDPTL